MLVHGHFKMALLHDLCSQRRAVDAYNMYVTLPKVAV